MNVQSKIFGRNRPLPTLILVHGLKESGKSTLADHYCDELGYKRVKLAGPLKNMVRSLLRDGGVDPDIIEDYIEGDLKEIPIPQMSNRSARHLMQTLGDDWRRMQALDFWIDITIGKLTEHFASDDRVIIDDIRYPNELSRLSVYNPLTFVVTRGKKHFEPVEEGTPLSEVPMEVDKFNFHIANDYSEKIDLWNYSETCIDKWASTF